MKVLTKEEMTEHSHYTVRYGLAWGTAATVGSSAAIWYSARRGMRPFATLSIPLRGAVVASVGLIAVVFGGEHGSQQYELQRMLTDPSGRQKAIEGNREQQWEHQAGLISPEELRKRAIEEMTPFDQRIEWLKDNKMKLITGIWAASLGGSFLYIYRSPLSFAQKIVQARVYAQAIAVVLILAGAGLAAVHTAGSKDEDDAAERKEMAMYRWKGGNGNGNGNGRGNVEAVTKH